MPGNGFSNGFSNVFSNVFGEQNRNKSAPSGALKINRQTYLAPYHEDFDTDEYFDKWRTYSDEKEYYKEIRIQIYYLMFILTNDDNAIPKDIIERLGRVIEYAYDYHDKNTDQYDNTPLEDKLIKAFEHIIESYENRSNTLPNIFHLLAQGKFVTNRTGPSRLIRYIGTLGRDNVKYEYEIGTINKELCEITNNTESRLRNFLRENKAIQKMLTHNTLFATNNVLQSSSGKAYTPEDIADMNKNTDGACFIDNIVVPVEEEATILPPQMATVVSTDEHVPIFSGGKSRRSRKQKKRASKSKKSKKSRKTARKQ